jgi:preprotein translocase subunit SecA
VLRLNLTSVKVLIDEIIISIKKDLKSSWLSHRYSIIEAEKKAEIAQKTLELQIPAARRLEIEAREEQSKFTEDKWTEHDGIRILKSQVYQIHNNLYNSYNNSYSYSTQSIADRKKQKAIELAAEAKRYSERVAPNQWFVFNGFNLLRFQQGQLDAVRSDSYAIGVKIDKKYSDQFDNIWSNQLEPRFTRSANECKPDEILSKFSTRHPWTLASKQYMYRFLETIINDYLLNNLKTKLPGTSWASIKQPQLDDVAFFAWNPMDLAKLQDNIEGWPMMVAKTHANTDYDGLVTWNRAQTNSFNKTRSQATHWLNYYISRPDIFNLLTVNYPNEMALTSCNGISTTAMAPIHISELKQLKHEQILHFNTLFVNTALENQPLWILLNKHNKVWTAYVPSSGVASVVIGELQKYIPGIKFLPFTHTDNLASQQIAALDSAVKWHALLFARILPWCKKDRNIPLDQYRANVPLLLLVQQTLASAYTLYYKDKMDLAFLMGKPFSEETMEAVNYGVNSPKKTIFGLTSGGYNNFIHFAEPGNRINNILSYFESAVVVKNNESNSLQLTVNCTEKQLAHALTLVYHEKISRLTFSLFSGTIIGNEVLSSLFNLDTYLQSVKPAHATQQTNQVIFNFAAMCAARNRFLNVFSPSSIDTISNNIKIRQELWNAAGTAMVDFFVNQGSKITLDFVDAIPALKATWLATYCDHEAMGSDKLQQAYLQIAQMGTQGLTHFAKEVKNRYSQWEPRYRENTPELVCTFDLSGPRGAVTLTYLVEFVDMIIRLSTERAPIFKTLALVLPADFSKEHQAGLIKLIEAMHKRKLKYADENIEIVFYNLDSTSLQADLFIKELSTLAEGRNLNVNIRIPTWDRDVYKEKGQQLLKARYRLLQDQILDNQRSCKAQELPANFRALELSKQGRLAPGVKLEDAVDLTQVFDTNEVWYPLTTESHGIQQQQQQQQQQQMQQQQQQEQEQEQEQEQQVEIYQGRMGDLINRDNINGHDTCKKLWQELGADDKKRMAALKNDLSKFFSQVVGSDENAENVIAQVEPEAMYKLIKNAAQFRLGMNKDNLLAGFYLAHAIGLSDLILCFSPRREIDDLASRAKLELSKRDPFTQVFISPAPQYVFQGDYRQFTIMSVDNKKAQQTLWKFLALEDADKKRIENTIAFLVNNPSVPENVQIDVLNSAVIMQGIDINQQVYAPGEYSECLQILSQWAKGLGCSSQLRGLLFDDASTCKFTPDNLKAFGQLFNQYDAQQKTLRGSEEWLKLADQILKAFGADGLRIWKKRLLDSSQNWSEILEKTELDAIAFSIVTLKDNQHAKDMWWALVDAHGEAAGIMRYSHLWYAFEAVLKYVVKKEVVINKNSIFTYLKETPDFNALVFLDRLYEVLKRTGKSNDAASIQQEILNNFSLIDWRHSGLYYACRYDLYPYWDKDMLLTRFNRTVLNARPGYHVSWATSDEITKPSAHALRYISKRLKLSPTKYRAVKSLLGTYLPNLTSTTKPLRVLIGCLAMGVDSLETLKPVATPDYYNAIAGIRPYLLVLIDQQFMLNTNLDENLFQMRFADILVFANTMHKLNINGEHLFKFSDSDTSEFINGCGRALQYFSRFADQADKFEKLITLVLQENNLLHSLLLDYPWLSESAVKEKGDSSRSTMQMVGSWIGRAANKHSDLYQNAIRYVSSVAKKECDLFRLQLQSIDFSVNRYWPTYDELKSIYDAIITNYNSSRARTDEVNILVQKGCAITLQGAKFKKLSKQDVEYAIDRVTPYLIANFRKENLQLCKRFFSEYLAIKAAVPAQTQIDSLVEIFRSIDSKVYYNELGQILGLLMTQAQTQASVRSYYAAPQLGHWLSCLKPETNYENSHYPINLLQELLNNADTSKSLLNWQLNQLSETSTGNRYLAESVKRIVLSSLPNTYKPGLMKLAMSPGVSQYYFDFAEVTLRRLHNRGVSTAFLDATNQLLLTVKDCDDYQKLVEILTDSIPYSFNFLSNTDHTLLSKLWQEGQVTLMTKFANDELTRDQLVAYFSGYSQEMACIRIILTQIQAREDEKNKEASKPCSINSAQLLKLRRFLEAWPLEELAQISVYFSSEPKPSADVLLVLAERFENEPNKTAAAFIHEFEAVEQARGLRVYSFTSQDSEDIARVMAGIKLKGHDKISEKEQKQLLDLLHYTNSYSQSMRLDKLRIKDLTDEMMLALAETKKNKNDGYAAARLLACMREILLRKNGKWANHTQMLDLLYAAKHNDTGMLHQLRTGEGKSIVTVMRTSYLALQGKIVDVFSAKASLSERDYLEFAAVFEAMGIRHNYIVADSPADAYHDSLDLRGIGAINYATIGNYSLFHSALVWNVARRINLNPENRVAFLDEGDHLLSDEETQFNFSHSGGGSGNYNLDEWVYRIVNQYYLENKHHFELKDGALCVSNVKHLKPLCELIIAASKNAAKESRFIPNYIAPAINGRKEDIEARDTQLKLLLTAAHTAHRLIGDVNYCVRGEIKAIGDLVLNTRFAKVVINNQVIEGSTYSELVHQFLHVKLNDLAAKNGEQPNFFVEPVSEIALSQNASYLLRKHYHKLEGCTGTAGNADDRNDYSSRYGIHHIIKLPTHKEPKTTFLPTIYCESAEAQIQSLVDDILANKDKPILAACEDDVEVRRISAAVIDKLKTSHPDFDCGKIIVDTNDCGKTETEQVKRSKFAGIVTFSSRMGRGTDIKPEKPANQLMVLRTYPTIPRVVKQEWGRQGRNGAPGICRDTLDYSKIKKDRDLFLQYDSKKFNEIYEKEKAHLLAKLQKHEKAKWAKSHWRILHDDVEVREKYLVTRSVALYKHALKKLNQQYLRRKEDLLAKLSGHVILSLHKRIGSQDDAVFRNQWLACRSRIEAAWNARLKGQTQETEEIYNTFLAQAAKHWLSFASNHGTRLKDNIDLIADILPLKAPPKFPPVRQVPHVHNRNETVSFYEKWSRGTHYAYFSESTKPSADLLSFVYGERSGHLEELFKTFHETNVHELARGFARAEAKESKEAKQDAVDPNAYPHKKKIMNTLAIIAENPSCYSITCQMWVSVIKRIQSKYNDKNDYDQYLACLEAFFKQQWLNDTHPSKRPAADIPKISILFYLVMQIVTTKFVGKDDASINFINYFCLAIRTHFWDKLDAKFCIVVLDLFASNIDVTALLTVYTTEVDIAHYIDLAVKSADAHTDDRLQLLHKHLHDHQAQFEATPQAIRPHIEWIMSKEAATVKIEELPKLGSLSILTRDLEGDVWYFLSQRSDFTLKQTNELFTLISHQNKTEELKRYLINLLVALPPYVPLSYILPVLQFSAGKYNLQECAKQLAAVKEAGELCCQLMHDQGLIASSTIYKKPAEDNKADVDLIIQHFSSMTPELNIVCFNVLSKTAITLSLATKKILIDGFARKALVNKGQLEEAVQLALAIQALEQPARSVMQQGFHKFINNNKPNEAKNNEVMLRNALSLQQKIAGLSSEAQATLQAPFAKIMETDSAALLDPQTPIRLIVEVMHENKLLIQIPPTVITALLAAKHWPDKAIFTQLLTTVKTIQSLPAPAMGYLMQQLQVTVEGSSVSRLIATVKQLSEFSEALVKTEAVKVNFAEATIAALWSGWKDQRIHQEADKLQQAVTIAKTAKELDENDNWNDFFASYTSSQRIRQLIMQYLTHGLLDLGENFRNKCYKAYKRLAMITMPQLPITLRHLPPEKRHQLLRQQFSPVIKLAREMSTIGLHPKTKDSSPVAKREKVANHVQQAHLSYFKQQKGRYGSFYWKNSLRRTQAKQLFGRIMDEDKLKFDTKAEYYQFLLQNIWNVQREILNSDINTKHNVKGYSRLYDISTQMFSRVARDYLAEEDVTFGDKVKVYEILQQQLFYQINLVRNRLPAGHELKLKIQNLEFSTDEPWKIASDSLAQLNTTLREMDWKTIPQELRYLLKNIDYFMELPALAETPVKLAL